jgi:hypothetical protein
MKTCTHSRLRGVVQAAVLFLWICGSGHAQELQPRAYFPAPVGVGFGGIGYGRISGGLLFDPSLPIDDAHVDANAWSAAVGYYFGTLGRTSQVLATLPYMTADITGKLSGQDEYRYRSGLADTSLRYSINLLGSPAMRVKEFMRYRQRTILGVSLTALAPSGQYDPKVLINIGTNRWAFKPEMGVSKNLGRWTLEGAFGAWLYKQNTRIAGGTVRTQSPLWSTQAHVVRFVRRHWVAVDAVYFAGATAKVDGVKKSTNVANLRAGVTFGVFLTRRQAIRFNYFETFVSRIGGDTRGLGVAYQFLWATGR